MNEKPMCELEIKGGNKIVVYDRLAKESIYGTEQCARNIYLLAKDSKVLWQVHSNFDAEGNPFTNIMINENGDILAYRWDGGSYLIDEKTGFATPHQFLK